MNTEEEKISLELKRKLLNEIEYRERILRQLRFDSTRERGFVSNFIRAFLKKKDEVPNPFWTNKSAYANYLIEADKELITDIANAFEKSLNKMKNDYHNNIFDAVAKHQTYI